ncbi:hypothetical protein ACFRDV_39370 [Streptomyces fagopyri]|uniref:hypothetical protein n=1 Tax=Streptomyces fagopyri TaxID=2662397 RepID=UPI00369109B4
MATTTAGTCSTGRWNSSSTTAAPAGPSNSWKSSPAQYAEGHPDGVLHLRLWLLGEAGRCPEGIAQAIALNEEEPGEWDTALARLLERDGQLEAALALLRSSTHHLADLELADMLIQHDRPAEALAAIPTIAEGRAAAERRERERAQWQEQDDPWGGVGEFAQEPPL